MRSAVLLPAGLLFRGGAEWLFFAKADHLDAIGAHTVIDERLPYGRRAVFAQTHVVYLRPTLIAVSFYGELDVGMLGEKICIGFRNLRLVRPNIKVVIAEEDVLDILLKQLLVSEMRSGFSRNIDGNAGVSFSAAAIALSGQMIGGGTRGRNLF